MGGRRRRRIVFSFLPAIRLLVVTRFLRRLVGRRGFLAAARSLRVFLLVILAARVFDLRSLRLRAYPLVGLRVPVSVGGLGAMMGARTDFRIGLRLGRSIAGPADSRSIARLRSAAPAAPAT
jgi:hypothetical protein